MKQANATPVAPVEYIIYSYLKGSPGIVGLFAFNPGSRERLIREVIYIRSSYESSLADD